MKSESVKHTPGPWKFFADSGGVYSETGDILVSRVYGRTTETFEINALLIAAAPELLQMCRTLLGHLPCGNEALQIKCEKLIAKATGSEVCK